jgi:hypothetical protein
VWRERVNPLETGADDIERAVAIEQPRTALATDDRAESEVAISRLFLGRPPRSKRAGLKLRGRQRLFLLVKRDDEHGVADDMTIHGSVQIVPTGAGSERIELCIKGEQVERIVVNLRRRRTW